jgi:hypothetical protein
MTVIYLSLYESLVVKVGDLEEEIKLLTKQTKHCENAELKAKLEARMAKFKEIYAKKSNQMDEVDLTSNKHFAGLFSYNIAVSILALLIFSTILITSPILL